jgi:Queuosine biosynthesis protein QueC
MTVNKNYRRGDRIMNESKQNDDVCSSCFSSTKFPGIIIEQNGKCNRCNSDDFEKAVKNQTFSDISELRSIVDKLKKKSTGKYDCVIGASGGIDSSYIIYVAKKILNLNPLVVKYHDRFCHEAADNNLQTICKNLKVDFEIIKSKNKYDYKYIKFIVLALRSIGLYWGICSCCHYASVAVVLKAAYKNNISLHLEAVNKYEEHLFLHKSFKLRKVLNHLFKINLTASLKTVPYLLLANY